MPHTGELPPVGQKSLYSHLDVKRLTGTRQGHNTIFGKLLWLAIKTVVLLTEPMRQPGPRNKSFVDMLERLRHGKCTEDDFVLLNSRLLSNVRLDWNSPGWLDAPFIVSENEVKDKLNEQCATAYAKRVGRPLHWYYCID
ncbi:hypothetical protein BJ138DRAFT_1015795, partial [Hygrophoropsis aurantiaca]